MRNDVFISYKAEEFDQANYMKMILEKNNISCWMAPMCIPGGSNYAKEIPNAIRNSKVFVLILSKRAQESKWVPKELDQAINAGKIIMPFMIENCPLTDDFDFYLTNVQRYAAYENKTLALEKIITEIKKILENDNSSSDDMVEENHGDEIAAKTVLYGKSNGEKNKFLKFIINLTPYGRKKAQNPEYKFPLAISTICAVICLLVNLLVYLIGAVSIGDMSKGQAIIISFVLAILVWYANYIVCHLTVRIKVLNKLLSFLIIWITSFLWWLLSFFGYLLTMSIILF